LFWLVCGQASADEVWLKNSDHLTGKVVSLDAGTLVFKTSYAGDLSIAWGEVVNLKTDETIKVVLAMRPRPKGPCPRAMRERSKLRPSRWRNRSPLTLANVKAINPKPP